MRLWARLRAFLLRRVFGRLRITEDIVRHLSTFQRLGETLEIEAPREMLPVGARTVFRAVRTRASVQIRPEWLWPYWLERQINPSSPSFVPRGHLPFLTNLTHRNWTMIGVLDSSWEAIVDERGLVTPWFDGWSLDCVIMDGSRRYAPSHHDRVTQSLLGVAPVVETRIEIPGGTVISRAYAARADEEVAIVEVESRVPRPIEIAFAMRPYNPEGLAVTERITLDGTVVQADGRRALLLPRPPDRFLLSSFATGDSAIGIAHASSGERHTEIHDPVGLAQAAFAYRLNEGETIRVAMPLLATRRRRGRRRPPDPTVEVGALPTARDVAAGWRRVLAQGMQVRLPDERLQRAVDANRAAMLLFHDGDEITPGPFTYHRFWFRDAAYQLAALGRWGFHAEVAEVLSSYPARQRADGFFYSQHKEWDSNGAALWAIAEHYRLTRDDELLRELRPAVQDGARWITRQRRKGRRSPETQGLLPAGISAEHLGPFDYYYWDDFWALRGLRDAAFLLRAAGDRENATRIARDADDLQRDLFNSIALVSRRLGRPVIPAGPKRALDAGMVGSLVAAAPLQLLPATHPWIEGTLKAIRQDWCVGDAFYQSIAHTGLGTYLTLQLALVEIEAGDPRALGRLRWMLDAASPTFTWPEAIHPQLGTGCMGDGHHGWAAADLLSVVRNILVRETRDGLALLTLLPSGWEGREVTVVDAPTHHGRISWALSWSGAQPVLAWECERPDVLLTAPSLDPAWSTRERTGTAALRARRATG